MFVPLFSHAYFFLFPKLTIIVNTQGGDDSFSFNSKEHVYEYDEETGEETEVWRNLEDFTLQTSSLTASYDAAINFSDYSIEQSLTLGWKIDSINCTSDNPDNHFSYTGNKVNISNPQGGSSIVCVFYNVKTINKTPVLIVPGVTGTEMKKGDELLWADLGRMFGDVGDEFMDPLAFNNNLSPVDPNLTMGSILESPFIGQHFYDLLISEFEGQGYVEGESLFTFPYDWRYGVSGVMPDGKTNSDLLGEKINEILQQTGADKVDVVAHSMGGLVVKKYVMDNPADNKIGKAVFVGVPNTGAPKAVKGLIQGDNFGIPWLADSEVKKISANMPSAYDLLPSRQYYNVSGDSFIEVVNRTDLFNTEIRNLNYEESKSFLTDDHGLNSLALTGAENLHTQDFDNFDMRTAGVDLYAIDGCKAGTLGKVIEVRAKDIFGGDYITYSKPKEVPGDGTVPLESATNLPIDQNNKYYALVAEHGKMVSQNGIRQEIVNLVAESSLPVPGSVVTQDISQCQLNGKAISVFSPIDIFVTDQDGNKLGLAEDSSLMNEIPNADFEIWGEHKFVYLPTDNGQTYSVNIEGIGDGTYTIKTDEIQNSSVVATEVFSNLPVTAALVGQINLAGSATTLALDVDGDGATDQTVEASAILDAAQADDLTPPVSKAIVLGEKNEPPKMIPWLFGFKKQTPGQPGVKIEISSTDDNSGVLAVWYNLDGAGYQKAGGGSVQIDVAGQGKHTITFFGTDRAGNNELDQILSFEIESAYNRLKLMFTKIKNLVYNKLLIDIDQDKTKFPWNLGKMAKEISHSASKPAVQDILNSLKNKFNFNWPR